LSDHLAHDSRGRYLSVQFEQPQPPRLACLFLERTFWLYGTGMAYPGARDQALCDLRQVLESCLARARSKWSIGRLFGK
jgi:hypothetical protein